MGGLADEARRFGESRREDRNVAGQRVALALCSGVDLDDALALPDGQRLTVALRLTRFIERERIKGSRRHWGYDLNRHIALKQALDRLLGKDVR